MLSSWRIRRSTLSVSGRAIDAMTGVHSDRTRKTLTSIRRDLARFKGRGIRAAVELDDRVLTALRSA